MFKKKKKTGTLTYDKTALKPAVKASICTGEKVAGFKNRQSGKFEEIMLIRGEADLQVFMETYGIKKEEIEKIY